MNRESSAVVAFEASRANPEGIRAPGVVALLKVVGVAFLLWVPVCVVGLLASPLCPPHESPVRGARLDLQTLHPVADGYRAEHPNVCPTVELLQQERQISATSKVTDAWGHRYEDECAAEETYVRSWGPDGKRHTADDLVVPGSG
jgi:hypothetical protein